MFHEIRSSKDIQDFLEKTNWLHDGIIIDVRYRNDGISRKENGHWIDPMKTKLTLQILVTSISYAVVEIIFEDLQEWQIQDYPYYMNDIVQTSVRIEGSLTTLCPEENWIVWSSAGMDEIEKGSYAIAKSMKWRIVE